jgi:cobalt-zinc-cadmium efflux system membrane fusion protein
MNAEIETKVQDAVTVPEDAIVLYEKNQYIFLSKGNNLYEMTEVKTGTADSGFVEIIPESGDRLLQQDIVLKNAYSLLMKIKNTGEEE